MGSFSADGFHMQGRPAGRPVLSLKEGLWTFRGH